MSTTVLITGATDGLGRAAARALAERGVELLVHGRNREKGEATVRELRDLMGGAEPRLYLADLASLEQVRQLATEVERDCDRLDVLVNNAGVGGVRERQTSADGYELGFAVNYLAPFLLTELLLPLLRRSAPARIVNVSSAGQAPLDLDDLQLERGYDALDAYRRSKLAQILFTLELDGRLRRAGAEGLTVNALHPAALMDTRMVRDWFGRPQTSVEEGVEGLVRLVLAPELDGVSGRYFDGLREGRPNAQAYDESARRRLWEQSERLVEQAEAARTPPAR